MKPARILSTADLLAGGQKAQPLPQSTTFQLYVLVLPKYLSFFGKKKKNGGGIKLIMLFIENPLKPFKQISMGLQEILNIYKTFLNY